MGTHSAHSRLPGYHPDQLLVDDCPECEWRSRMATHGIEHLDPARFEHAWHRAAQWQTSRLFNLSNVEMPMLNAIWAIQVQLERRGVPIGVVPSGPILSRLDVNPLEDS